MPVKRLNLKKAKSKEVIIWPPYFHDLFKIFKAINTVLAFLCSRKHLATTLSVVRSSIEGLLKKPLELDKIAQLKALVPELIKFAYIPHRDLRVHASGRFRERSPNISCTSMPETSVETYDDQHVLVLEFAGDPKVKRDPCSGLTVPLSLTPAATKKLIAKRNERFHQAVDIFLLSASTTEDPIVLLQAAGLAHTPVNPQATSQELELPSENSEMQEPDSRPSVPAIREEIEAQVWYKRQIVHSQTFDAREGRMAKNLPKLSASVTTALMSRHISTLYTHQAAAIDAIVQGNDVVLSTSTASGKSLIYQVPTMGFLEENAETTSIFVYPTKALAQDQKVALERLIRLCPGIDHLKVAVYDGDTPAADRAGIREAASVIFTNFDMIHASILPYEHQWRRFLKNLKLFVIDELHYYSGLFGSHVAQIIRRLRRVCAAVGNRCVQFVSCSATIANPLGHMTKITGLDSARIVTIAEDGAPRGYQDSLIWNPSHIDATAPELGRHSSLSDATTLMCFLMKRGFRVILFCKIRKMCELAMKTVQTALCNEGRYDILERTMSYRGGYLQEERRHIEREAFNGRLLGIIATNALELGVDIGVLDVVIMLGFPVSISSFRQQIGRAGRRARDSLAIFVADQLPLDQQYVRFPERLFDKNSDDLVIDLDNKVLLEAHLQCAAQEMPLSKEDDKYFGPLMEEICKMHLVKDSEGWYHTHPKLLPSPSQYISIRGAHEEKYAVIDISKRKPGMMLEEVETSRAMFELYEGGVFLHQGLTFIIQRMSHDSKVAEVIQADVNWITSPRDFTCVTSQAVSTPQTSQVTSNVDAVQTYRIREIKNSPSRAYYGQVDVEVKVFGFFKIRNKFILEAVDLETPTWHQETTGLWIDVPNTLLNLFQIKGIRPSEAIHATQHAVLNQFSMAQDLKTECKAPEKEYKIKETKRKRPARLIFYDAVAKGGGVAVKAFDYVNGLLINAFKAVESCDCQDGCSACIQNPGCKEGNVVSSKLGANLILKALLGFEIDPDSVASMEDVQTVAETIVPAQSVRALNSVQVESSY